MPFGSWAAPARTSMRALTIGCSFWLTSTTLSPLGRVRISYFGKLTGLAESGRGGRSVGQRSASATMGVRGPWPAESPTDATRTAMDASSEDCTTWNARRLMGGCPRFRPHVHDHARP